MLDLVETAFDDVAGAVAAALVSAEVDGASGSFAVVGDLVIAFGDRGVSGVGAQPCTTRPRGVALVDEEAVRALARVPGHARDANLLEHSRQHGRVRHLTAGEDEHEGSPRAVGDRACLGRQPAAREPDRVIRGFIAEILVNRVPAIPHITENSQTQKTGRTPQDRPASHDKRT